jgi:hypothetical protein
MIFELMRFDERHLCVKAFLKADFLKATGATTIPPRPSEAHLQELVRRLIRPFPASEA